MLKQSPWSKLPIQMIESLDKRIRTHTNTTGLRGEYSLSKLVRRELLKFDIYEPDLLAKYEFKSKFPPNLISEFFKIKTISHDLKKIVFFVERINQHFIRFCLKSHQDQAIVPLPWSFDESVCKDKRYLALKSMLPEVLLHKGKIDISSFEDSNVFSLFVPYTKCELSSTYAPKKKKKSHVLIDDDFLIRESWRMAAESSKIALDTYASGHEFMAVVSEYSKDIQIYIDQSLGDTQGHLVAQQLFELGFENLTLQTGYNDQEFLKYPFIKNVISKKPPFLL